jgi:RHS repeat-associated protein
LTASTYGYNFDSAGNTTRDASDQKFTYDAENKQTKVESLTTETNTVTGTVGEYFYDGDGKRVKKYVPSTGETTVFIYDATGKLIEEYSTNVATTNDAKVAYLTNDHLGSPRINTDANGSVIARHDYHPFGEEIATSQRTTDLNYGGDTVRKQFTGYERDQETALDYAKARYFGSSTGRFSSPDDFHNDSDVRDPQSWNLYVYCRNNPLNCVDSTGREATVQITIDEKTKKGKIVIAATIGIWTQDAQISQEDMKKAAEKIQKNIQDAWKGSVTKDGIEYEVSTVVSVQAYKDEAEAEKYGAKNIIEMAKGPIDPANNADSNAGSGGFFTSSDRGKWNINSTMSGTTAQHEFGHLLGVGNKPGFTLMNTDPSARHPTMTAEDFDWTFGREVTAQRQQSRMTTVIEDRERGGWRRREVDSGSEHNSNRSYNFRAPKLAWWWKSQ